MFHGNKSTNNIAELVILKFVEDERNLTLIISTQKALTMIVVIRHNKPRRTGVGYPINLGNRHIS